MHCGRVLYYVKDFEYEYLLSRKGTMKQRENMSPLIGDRRGAPETKLRAGKGFQGKSGPQRKDSW